MQAYAIYRLPHEDHATIIRQKAGDPVELNSLTELNGKKGFVVAPFEVKGDQPVVVIEGESERIPLCAPAHTRRPARGAYPRGARTGFFR